MVECGKLDETLTVYAVGIDRYSFSKSRCNSVKSEKELDPIPQRYPFEIYL